MKCLGCAALFGVALSAVSAFASAHGQYEVPFAAKAPVVDGVASPGEWDAALRIIGAGKPVDARRAEIAFAWDAGWLYVMAKSETAPRNRLVTTAESRPGSQRIVMDDSVELWFDPPKELRSADETKRFGTFQIIVSHNGNVYGCHQSPGYGLQARDWKLDAMKKASVATNDIWTLELAIPAKAFGLARFEPMELPLLAVRNFRIQRGVQAPFLPPGGGFMDSAHYPKMRLSRGAKGSTLDRRSVDLPPFEWKTPEACIVADLAGTGVAHGAVKGVKLPVPGSMVIRSKATSKMEKKGWRRYFSTGFRNTGYLGFQEDTVNGRTMLFFAHHFKGAPNVNRRMKCPADGRESVIAVNFEPKKVTYYLNGVKHGETDMPTDLSEAAFGDLVLGGGEPGLEILDWTRYSRVLTDAEVKANSQGDSPVSGTLKWYPTINSLVADITCDAAKLKCGELEWSVAKRGETGVAASGGFPLSTGYPMDGGGRALTLLRRTLPLGVELPEGEYIARLMRLGEEDALMEVEFSVRNYEWVGNSVGKEDRLLPGFTPVVAAGNILKCVGREYEIGPNGFPSRVVADGEQILAAPVALHAEKDGKSWIVGGGGSKARQISETRAEYVARADGYTLKGSLEQDGLLRFTIRFSRVPDADRVWLEVPVKKEFATLFHACGEGVRANPAGFVPAGEGVVFKSRDIPQTHVSNFIPYCWVGTDTRGICYAADVDIGWAHTEKRDAVEVVRTADGTVSIVLNLINAPFEAGVRDIELALMASPVKPMPKGWRGWADGFDYRGTQCSKPLASPPYWGNFTGWGSRYPAWGEFEYVRKLREAMDTGKIDEAYLKNWIDRVCSDASSETAWVNKKDPKAGRAFVTAHAGYGMRLAASLHNRPNPILYFYTCDADWAQNLAEYVMFRDEWTYRVSEPSYADYAIWYLDKMVEAGMRGVYDDNTFICCNFHWATGGAKIDDKGVVHPSFGIWNCREYRRRQANVLASRGLFPWITVHHTNGNILPVLGFAANSMGMEWKYGPSDFQTRFSPDYIRAVCQGLQGGFFPTVLDGITGLNGAANKEERIRVTRTMMASLLVHEVRPTIPRGSESKTIIDIMNVLMDFGIGADDCVYSAYWDVPHVVVCNDKDVLVSVYRRGLRFLAVCGSWADGDRDVELSMNPGILHRFVSAKNAETGAAIPVSGGKARFRLAKHDLALVELK